jgi:hypothetical protein
MKWLLLLLLLPSVHALDWSEVLFNPAGNDNGKEYVELIGTENLDGCTIRDSASADKLAIHRRGLPSYDIIMIVENESAWINTAATTYVVGSAIGNGLGNSFDIINITCGNDTLLTSYNTSALADYKEGHSIIFDGMWKTGPVDGTPGTKNLALPLEAINETESTITLNGGSHIICNDSLSITMSATSGVVGEPLHVTILAQAFTTYEAIAGNTTVATGNTLKTNEHTIYLPNASSMKITAYATACGRKQRAIRYISITRPVVEPEIIEVNLTTPKLAEVEEAPPTAPAPPIVVKTIVDDRSMVPWIATFGSITILVSAGVFLHLLRREGRDN